jgi:RNA polymerase sigma-70 factor (ECF subfamily)
MERVSNTEEKAEASDRELLERCRAGDETAFDDLVLRHQQRAFNIAFQVVQDYEDATEVAQDAFVKIYRNVDNFRWECEFTTWLHQIVVNLARNKYRWWKRRGKQASVSMDSPITTADGEMSLQIADSADAPDVQTVKAEFLELLSQRVKSRIARAREMLRESMKEDR